MKKDSKILLQELDQRPYHAFNIAFSLMTLLPLLAVFYLLVNELFTIEILSGQIGLVLFIALVISLCGYLVGYKILSDILEKILFYAAKAKRSDRLKSKLIASVSHEFKNPLSSLKLCLFDVVDGSQDVLSAEQKETISRCNKIIDRLSGLVNDLLDLYRIEAGMVEMKKTLCNCVEIIETQANELASSLKHKDLKIIKQFEGNEINIWADREKIEMVINNLLGNAVKHSFEKGSIVIKVFTDNEFVRIEFINYGELIPKKNLEKIFDKFEKLNQEKEGTGLGLVIAKDIVELHRGKIWASSDKNKGTVFTVVLPKSLRIKKTRKIK